MSDLLFFDPMFRVPFFVGLTLTVILSLTGTLLRMRDEWLAALGLSQLVAVGSMLSVILKLPSLVMGFVAAVAAMCLRVLLPRVDNSHYANMIIMGWAGTLILGSYMDHGQVLGEALLRGQLYFTRPGHLVASIALLLVLVSTFRPLSSYLLTARFFPDYHKANRIPVWHAKLGYAGIVAAATVLGTISIGAFPTFAMLFVPPWTGFVLASGWMKSVLFTVLIGVVAYMTAFPLAMIIDLPVGPVLTAVLVLSSGLRNLTARKRRVKINGFSNWR